MMSDSDVSGSCDRGGHGCESVGSGSGAGIGLATYELGWCWWCAKFLFGMQVFFGPNAEREEPYAVLDSFCQALDGICINHQSTGNDQKTPPSKPSQDRPTPGRDKFLNPI